MKVTISTPCRFWAFSLAEQLQQRGYLDRLLVGYFNPNKNAKGFDIDQRRVVKNIIPFAIGYSPNKIKALKRYQFAAQFYSCELHDRWASRQLQPCDIFVGWSSLCFKTVKKAKALGAVTIVERGSSHILYQKEILEQEYKILGDQKKVIEQRIVEKELKEYEAADYISIPSSFVKRTFLEKGIAEKKLLQVPYGVSLKHFKPISKSDDIFRIIHVGGSVRKGTHYLLQAMTELNLRNAELFIIGEIEDVITPFLKKYNGQLKITAGVGHSELYKYYSQGSVYVIPSIEEGLAMVQAEAMACSLPVICSPNTGGEDIIRDGVDGFVVSVRDVEALKEKILDLYENEKRRKEMSHNSLERVKEFTWDNYGAKVVENYHRILMNGKRLSC